MSRPTVVVIALGGTISCAPSDDLSKGLVPATNPTEGLKLDGITVRSVTWSMTDSAEITFEEIVQLAREVRAQVRDGAAGVVVTQGTDTLEETAYALSLLRPTKLPVVFTGAMRAPTMPGSDADANLLAAITTAVHPELPRMTAGAVVVMNDQIHSAKWVRKAHTQRVDAFSSASRGDLGHVSEGQVTFVRRDPAPVVPALLDSDTGRRVKVAQHTVALDQDPELVASIRSLGYEGLVVEGMGGGHVSGRMAESLEKLAEAMPVVFASRTRDGAVLTRTYGSPGAELDLIRRKCVPSGVLSGLKARVLLTMLLRSGYGREAAEELVCGEGEVAAAVPARV